MDTYQALVLSGSASGAPILINAITAGTANTVHTCHATNIHELWLAAYNYSNVDVDLVLCLAGIAAGQQVTITVPAKRGIIPVLSGIRFTGSAVIKAFTSVTASIAIVGNVNNIVTV